MAGGSRSGLPVAIPNRPIEPYCFRRSPHAYAIRRTEIQALTRLDGKRGVPRVEIAHRVSAVLIKGVTIGEHDPSRELFSILVSPALTVTDEEGPIVPGLGVRLLSA